MGKPPARVDEPGAPRSQSSKMGFQSDQPLGEHSAELYFWLVVPNKEKSCSGSLQMASSALTHSTLGLRSPVLARAMSLLAMACLTWSSQSPVHRLTQASSSARPRARLVSRSK